MYIGSKHKPSREIVRTVETFPFLSGLKNVAVSKSAVTVWTRMCAHIKHTKQRRGPLLRLVILTSDPLFRPCAQLRGWHWEFEQHTHTLSEGEICSEGDCTYFSLLTSSFRRALLTNLDILMNCFLGHCSAGTAPNWCPRVFGLFKTLTEVQHNSVSCFYPWVVVWQLTQVNQCTSYELVWLFKSALWSFSTLKLVIVVWGNHR